MKNVVYLVRNLLRYNPTMLAWVCTFSIITLVEIFFEKAPYKVGLQTAATLGFIVVGIWFNTIEPFEVGLFALVQAIYILCLQKLV